MSGTVKVIKSVRAKTKTERELERMARHDRQRSTLKWLAAWFTVVILLLVTQR
jgi:hypothetical protein